MTEKDEKYELEQLKRSSLDEEELTGSGIDKERKDYLDIINIIETLMQDKSFPLKNESVLTINKILSFLNKEIYTDRNFTEAWLIKGTVLYKTGKYNSAIDAFDGALETMPKEISKENMGIWKKNNSVNYRYALKFKAFSLCKLGRYKEALDALDEISAIYPADSEIQKHKTMIHTLKKEKLIRGTSDIPDSYPKNSNTWERRGRDSYELGKYEEALKEFEKGLENNPKDADIWGNKGSAFYMLGRYEEALEAFNKSLEINPKNANAWSFKGSTLYKLNRPEEALKAFDKALQKNPNILEAWLNKGAILFELGRYNQSLSAMENVLRINPKDVDALNLKNSINHILELTENN
ncbi:tetratricopeptide repeat protein [Methanosarcina sp.]|uniref:tetratricopeptide repeat protein n=1 Tax=Methanosarcina sp. TaxID=2213 RepID=UPI002AB91527|nr:tetratricopeptide repeat protein [Methanosarcina sp.]MDY9926108.1 tetratricopeptide repeat protein [Methanosarcina sp.]